MITTHHRILTEKLSNELASHFVFSKKNVTSIKCVNYFPIRQDSTKNTIEREKKDLQTLYWSTHALDIVLKMLIQRMHLRPIALL